MNTKKIHIFCIGLITLLFMCNLVSAGSDELMMFGTNFGQEQDING
mgnify:CR=1 FL=1